MENQIEFIKTFKRLSWANDVKNDEIEEWLNVSKSLFDRLSRGDKLLDYELIEKMQEKIDHFEKTGQFVLINKEREKIDFDVLEKLDEKYMNVNGAWDKEAYDDPLIDDVLYYEDVDVV